MPAATEISASSSNLSSRYSLRDRSPITGWRRPDGSAPRRAGSRWATSRGNQLVVDTAYGGGFGCAGYPPQGATM